MGVLAKRVSWMLEGRALPEKADVLSRHRLPRPYRQLLVGFWIAPGGLLLLALWLGTGNIPAILDLRLWIPLVFGLLPALYIWQEGIDVLPDGLRCRVHLPRFYAYNTLDTYYYDRRSGRRLLTIWDAQGRRVLECHAAHLTDFPVLLRALHKHVRDRHWPPNS